MEYVVHLDDESIDALKKACGVEVETLDVSENGSYTADKGKAYNKVNVSVQSSGGGGADLKTIAVTIETASEEGVMLTGMFEIDEDGYAVLGPFMNGVTYNLLRTKYGSYDLLMFVIPSVYTVTSEDAVNCVYAGEGENGAVIITDSTQPASITLIVNSEIN